MNKNISKGLLIVVLFYFLAACQTTTNDHNSKLKTEEETTTLSLQNYFFAKKDSTTPRATLSLVEIKKLKKGDIILRKGFGIISEFIADYLDEKYPITHCGLVTLAKDSSLKVLHTISNDKYNGMLLEPLTDYCLNSKKGSLIAVRIKTNTSTIDTIMVKAHLLLQQKIMFDMAFDDHDNSKLYCIEMIRNILKETTGKDWLRQRISKQGLDVLAMANLVDTAHFQIIFNQFDSLKKSELNLNY